MGVVQHHDSITGTEKQFVADDYARMLDAAIKTAQEPISTIIGYLQKLNYLLFNLFFLGIYWKLTIQKLLI